MTQLMAKREQATPGATSQNISTRLRALSVRPDALTVREVIQARVLMHMDVQVQPTAFYVITTA